MSRVEDLEREIEKLSPPEMARLRDWILELDWQAWDDQIERDSTTGKLDRLFERSLRDHKAGKTEEM